jgi:hypothetical protein
MSSPYSQEQAVESSAVNCSVGKRSALLKSTPTVNGFLCSGRMMECWNRSQSGETSEHLTASRGLALSMLLAADSHAKTSAQPELERASPESAADCGPRWHGSFSRFDPATSSWKTRQSLLTGGLEEFSETWPDWGLMRDGECSVRPTLEPRRLENASGLWPTPRAAERGAYQQKGSQAWLSITGAVRVSPKGPPPKTSLTKLEARNIPPFVGGSLSPMWIEWLQGLPIGWTDCAPLEIAKYQQWRAAHGRP